MPATDLLWLDSDILLDWLAARSPWDVAAKELRPDFEDELQIAAACSAGDVTVIITRNLNDYANCGISALTAADWLRLNP